VGVKNAVRAIIVAVSPEGVIGVRGAIPWRHRGDMKRFKRVTMGGTLIMGRITFDSLGRRPLPGRRNIVVTRGALEITGVESATSVDHAVSRAGDAAVWFIGGAQIYEAAMGFCDFLDVTYVPDRIDAADAVRMPAIDESVFEPGPLVEHEDEPTLVRRVFIRRRVS
jgi:dihydrofolate reductase